MCFYSLGNREISYIPNLYSFIKTSRCKMIIIDLTYSPNLIGDKNFLFQTQIFSEPESKVPSFNGKCILPIYYGKYLWLNYLFFASSPKF